MTRPSPPGLTESDWRLLETLATERGKALCERDVDHRLEDMGLVTRDTGGCALYKLTRAAWCLLMCRDTR